MPGDQNEPEFVSEVFPELVGQLQQNAVKAADQAFEQQRQAARKLRDNPDQQLSIDELMKKMSGEEDEETRQAKLEAEIDRVNKEAAEAAKAKEPGNVIQPGRFPAPPVPAGR